jgi:hypothetical protein
MRRSTTVSLLKKHDSQFVKKKAQQHLKYAKLAQVPKNGRQPICSKKNNTAKKKPGPESEIPGRPEGFVPAIAVPPREHALENRSPQQTQI